ncbi:integrin-linked protein kinase-like [Hydractinia symbiolongicarpus]|uniref:integrin-linked protein kinase-like n=1 Tax=Hydractinia symbiolongicarpus TaxID=13093 RepID=UPI00254EA799|nr:integrin-linked protein kinase-like [Hydractinia symbiolongicarpus]
MEDIFSASREGNVKFVRQFLDNIENDLNEGDDHGFTPLHWACREGQLVVFEMLMARGGRASARNDGGDTALHLACAHGNKDIVHKLIQHKANVNLMNEHGNTPLHYACFWNLETIAVELVNKGALVSQCNRYDETPLDKATPFLKNLLKEKAKNLGQDLNRVEFQEPKNLNNSSYDYSTLKGGSVGIDIGDIHLMERISESSNGELFKGVWNNVPVVAKKLKVHGFHKRLQLHFNEEYPRLRIFSHPNILPVINAVTKQPNLMVISQFMPYGSLYNILHEGTGIVVDQVQAIKFALDIAKGMAYFHSLEPLIQRFNLTSFHVVIDEDLTARISMQDVRYSFQDHTKIFRPNWMSPEVLRSNPASVDQRSADMWSFAIIMWELATREVPYISLSAMECGMKIATEGCRPPMQPGMPQQLNKLITLCWNADPTKRPRFDQIVPILQKM